MYNKSLKVTAVTEAKLSVILEEARATLAESGEVMEKNEFSDHIVKLGIKSYIESRDCDETPSFEDFYASVSSLENEIRRFKEEFNSGDYSLEDSPKVDVQIKEEEEEEEEEVSQEGQLF